MKNLVNCVKVSVCKFQMLKLVFLLVILVYQKTINFKLVFVMSKILLCNFLLQHTLHDTISKTTRQEEVERRPQQIIHDRRTRPPLIKK